MALLIIYELFCIYSVLNYPKGIIIRRFYCSDICCALYPEYKMTVILATVIIDPNIVIKCIIHLT